MSLPPVVVVVLNHVSTLNAPGGLTRRSVCSVLVLVTPVLLVVVPGTVSATLASPARAPAAPRDAAPRSVSPSSARLVSEKKTSVVSS